MPRMRLAALRVDRHRGCRAAPNASDACRAWTGSFCFFELPWVVCPIKFSSINPAIRQTAFAGSSGAGARPQVSGVLQAAIERQRQQQFFLGQFAQRYRAFVHQINLSRRIRGRLRFARCKFNLALAGHRQFESPADSADKPAAASPARRRVAPARPASNFANANRAFTDPRASANKSCNRDISLKRVDALQHRRICRQARAINSVRQARCHGPRIIGRGSHPCQNESGASLCF